ncbi:MAG: hypothetical protein COA78_20380 [Blastopirellula sp.]|nr:MAG: hypothetical protein COA78_20380 [Blastopirellula sp.]
MREIWAISDTHFNHYNILKFDTGRGGDFDTLQEMNETIIKNWNEKVKQGDYVYHLGDVYFGNSGWFKTQWPRLNGSKRLIVGNHDDIKFLSAGAFFKKVSMWRMFPEYRCVLTHTPIHLGSGNAKYTTNIHGHTHRNWVTLPNGQRDTRYLNICVENTDYSPVHLYSTMERLQKLNA